MKKYLYKGSHTIYGTEEVFVHKWSEEREGTIEIIDIKIYRVSISKSNPEGVSYSLVFVRDKIRIVGFDNCEGHEKDGNKHHKHIKERICPYKFVDEWKLLQDFNEEVEKMRRGIL